MHRRGSLVVALALALAPWSGCGSPDQGRGPQATGFLPTGSGPTTASTGSSGGTETGSTGVDPGSTGSGTGSTGDQDGTGSSTSGPLFDVGGADGTTGGATGGGETCTPTVAMVPAKPCAMDGITMTPPFDDDYTCWNLGPIPDVPLNWGGIQVHPDDPDVLLVGGDSNEADGRFYGVRLARDAHCHVIGFQDEPPIDFSAGEYNDGNIEYHPDSAVLFYTRWPVNELGQILPGSNVTNRVIDLYGVGVAYSLAGLSFVPSSFPGAGRFKMVSWPDGQWYDATLDPDGNGTYDVVTAQHVLTLPGGPEGVAYIHPGNAEFPTHSMLIADWSVGTISAYESDGQGDPVLASRRQFVGGLDGAEGALVDPASGDFLFGTWGGDNVLIAIHGFAAPPPRG